MEFDGFGFDFANVGLEAFEVFDVLAFDGGGVAFPLVGHLYLDGLEEGLEEDVGHVLELAAYALLASHELAKTACYIMV